MNIENLINEYKCKKLGLPTAAVIVGRLDSDILEDVKNKISKKYNLEDEKYATNESVFYQTRRIVAKTEYIKTQKQLYTSIDFDHDLLEIISPIVNQVKLIFGNAEPTLIQIATILPSQKLSWHIDTFLYQQFSNKIHIPLFTNEKAFYDVMVGGSVKRIHMSAGNIWNINNLDLHRSINLGTTYRSHLIMDFIDIPLLQMLDETGINYFHHRLSEMSRKELLQIEELKKYA